MQVGIHERVSLLFIMMIGLIGLIWLMGLIRQIPVLLSMSLCIPHRVSNGLKTFCSVIRRTNKRTTNHVLKTFL